jgi:hypothetical protein
MPTGRSLTADQLTAARRAYETGATFQALADQHGVSKTTMIKLLRSVGVTSRAVGWPKRPKSDPPRPQPRPAVEIVPDVTGRLRIPLRTPEERRCRAWLPAELAAIAYEIRAGRFTIAPRGRSGLPEKISASVWEAARFSFWLALQRVKAAA